MTKQQKISLRLSLAVISCMYSVVMSQERGRQSLEVLSKTMKLESTQFIQIPGPNPLLTPAENGWDKMYNEAADIFKDDNTYYLYYHASGDNGYQVGVATADHPLGPWKKYEKNPILELGAKDSWEPLHVACAFVLKEGPAKYYMWYSGMKQESEDSEGIWGIGLATASSPLGPWKKYENNPIMRHFGYVGGVVTHQGKYYLYTAHPIGSTGVDYSPMSLAIADNPEGPYVEYEGAHAVSRPWLYSQIAPVGHALLPRAVWRVFSASVSQQLYRFLYSSEHGCRIVPARITTDYSAGDSRSRLAAREYR